MEKKKAVKTKKKADNTGINHELEKLESKKDITSFKNQLFDDRAGDFDNNLLAINTDDTSVAHVEGNKGSSDNNMLERVKVNQNNNRKRKQSNNYEEDVIDGFLIVSYSTVQELESDGPIRPGAAVGGKTNKSTKEKKKSKASSKKTKKSDSNKSMVNSPNTETTEVVKKKKKKVVHESVNDVKSPLEVSQEIVKTKENINNVSKKEKTVDEIVKSAVTPILIKDRTLEKEKIELNDLSIDPKSKSISDFSINAIQSLIKSPVNIAPAPPGSQMTAKSLATMPGLPSRNESVSPLSLSFQRALSSRGDTFNSFMGLDGNSLPGRSPLSGGLSRKSESIFVDKSSSGNGGRIFQISETSKIRVAVSNGNNQSNMALNNSVTNQFLKDRDMTRMFNASSNNVRVTTSSDRSGSPKSRGSGETTHQHQHQHVHQHQHQHQHFHPPYPSHPANHGHNSSSTMGPVPPMAGPYSQMYTGGIPYNMSMTATHLNPAQHSSQLLTTAKGTGKWCGLHIKIARFIQKAKAERHSMITYDHPQGGNRNNFHAFQAVQSRGHSYRDIDYHTQHFRSSISPPGNAMNQSTGGNLRSSLIRNAVDKDQFSRSRSFVPVHHSKERNDGAAHLPFGGLGSAFNGSTIRSDTIIKPRASPSRYTHSRIDYDRYQRSNPLPSKHESSQFLHSAATYRHDTETHSETERHNRFTSAIFDKEKKHNVNRFRTLTIDSRDRHSPTFMARDYLGSMRKVSPRSGGLCLPSANSSSSSLLKSFESRYMEAPPDTYATGHSINRVDVRSYSPAGRGVAASPFPPITSSRHTILPFTGNRYSGHPST